MSNKMNIFFVDKTNNIIDEINIKKPQTYIELLSTLKNNFTKLSEDFIIFHRMPNKNNDIEIHNDIEYQLSKDIIFIRNKEINELKQSIFTKNYEKLSESKQNLLDEKYACFICTEFIKTEKPLFCYICQKIFHHKCLQDWEKKKRLQNEILKCPHCMKELSLDQWKQKLDYEENRKNEGEIMDKLNQIQLDNNLNNNINKIKEKKIKELINDNSKQNEIIKKYLEYFEKTSNLFKNILNKINEIHSLFIPEINNKLLELLKKELSSNISNIPIDDISNVIFEEFEELKKYIKN